MFLSLLSSSICLYSLSWSPRKFSILKHIYDRDISVHAHIWIIGLKFDFNLDNKKKLSELLNEPEHNNQSTTKQTKWPVCPVMTWISLGIHPVWSIFAVCFMGSQGPKPSSCWQRSLWSDRKNQQNDLFTQSNQPSLCALWVAKDPNLLQADSLICTFVIRCLGNIISVVSICKTSSL